MMSVLALGLAISGSSHFGTSCGVRSRTGWSTSWHRLSAQHNKWVWALIVAVYVGFLMEVPLSNSGKSRKSHAWLKSTATAAFIGSASSLPQGGWLGKSHQPLVVS
jgi:hypothetical protein